MATGLAGRYATALFGLAREGKQIDTVSASLAKVRAALAESEDFRALTASPLIGRGAATSAVLGAAEAMGLDGIIRNFLGVLATNRSLGALADIIRAYETLAAKQHGEITARIPTTFGRPALMEKMGTS